MIKSVLASTLRIGITIVSLLAAPACYHGQLKPPTLASAKSPASFQIIENTKNYHISKFEKLCISLEYASKFILTGNTARDIREALRACYWIYGNSNR